MAGPAKAELPRAPTAFRNILLSIFARFPVVFGNYPPVFLLQQGHAPNNAQKFHCKTYLYIRLESFFQFICVCCAFERRRKNQYLPAITGCRHGIPERLVSGRRIRIR
jgi:hypothetical protein